MDTRSRKLEELRERIEADPRIDTELMRDIAAYVEWRQSSHPSFEDLANELGIVDWLVEDCVKRFGVRKRKKSGKRRRRRRPKRGAVKVVLEVPKGLRIVGLLQEVGAERDGEGNESHGSGTQTANEEE